MNQLNREHLLELKAWAEKDIERIKIRRANAPLFDSLRGNTKNLVTKRIHEIMAEPRAAVPESCLKLEASLLKSDRRQIEAEEGRRQRLDQALAYTAALQAWLEAIS